MTRAELGGGRGFEGAAAPRSRLLVRRLVRRLALLAVLAAGLGGAPRLGFADEEPPKASPPVRPPAPPPAPPDGGSPEGEKASEEKEAAPPGEGTAGYASLRGLQLVPEDVELEAPPSALLRRVPDVSEALDRAAPFFADTDLRLRARTFYFDRQNEDESRDDAWALGGWIQYASGWAADVFSVGATLYTSQPLWAPEDRDGTSLLAPGQEPITTLGQAYGRLRYEEYAVLTGYRQSVDEGYVNPQDNRMVPNTFEGVLMKGKAADLAYSGGYLWRMKPRNSNDFIPMSEQAGVSGENEGLWLGSLTYAPEKSLEVYAADYYLPEIYNTAFGRAKYTPTLNSELEGRFGVQGTDQRSVGDDRLEEFETWNVGAGAGLKWSWGLSVGTAVHLTGQDASIRSPFGVWPGWLSMIEKDFDRANELGWGVAATWDFGAGSGPADVPGLTLRLAYAQGTGREDPGTGEDLPTTREYDLDAIYNVSAVPGLQLRFRNAYVDSDGPVLGYQFRFIVNYEIELF